MKTCLLCLSVIAFSSLLATPVATQDVISNLDFLRQPTFTDGVFWNNYVGLNLYMDEIISDWNTSNFQGYFQNSNLYGNWRNNIALNIKMPKGWFNNCTIAQTTSTGVDCLK